MKNSAISRIEIHIGGMGEGAHIFLIEGDSQKELDYMSYVDHSPEDVEDRARELSDELSAEFVGWML